MICVRFCASWPISCFDALKSGFIHKKISDHNENRGKSWNNASPWCWNTVVVQFRESNQSKVLSSKANMLLCAVGRCGSARRSGTAGQSQHIPDADSFMEMTDLIDRPLKQLLFADHDSEWTCVLHYWLDFRTSPGQGRGKNRPSICLSDSQTQKEVLSRSIMGGNEPSELKEEEEKALGWISKEDSGVRLQFCNEYGSSRSCTVESSNSSRETKSKKRLNVSLCWCSFGMNIGPQEGDRILMEWNRF